MIFLLFVRASLWLVIFLVTDIPNVCVWVHYMIAFVYACVRLSYKNHKNTLHAATPKKCIFNFQYPLIYHVYSITRSLNYINFQPWILFLYYYCYFCMIFFFFLSSFVVLRICSLHTISLTTTTTQTHTTTAVRMSALPDNATAAVAGVNLTCKTTRHSKNDSS